MAGRGLAIFIATFCYRGVLALNIFCKMTSLAEIFPRMGQSTPTTKCLLLLRLPNVQTQGCFPCCSFKTREAVKQNAEFLQGFCIRYKRGCVFLGGYFRPMLKTTESCQQILCKSRLSRRIWRLLHRQEEARTIQVILREREKCISEMPLRFLIPPLEGLHEESNADN